LRLKSNPDCTDTQPYNSIDIEGSALSVHDGETVLETLERFKVEVNYNCREGFCGVCRTKLLSGTVEYKIEPLAFIDDDEILSCCSLPTSNISIKVNV
jgi:ferredoxin